MASSFKNTIINDTGYLQLPSGTTAQRPNYTTQTFTTVGTTSWTAPTDVNSVEVLVVAGGGSGGNFHGGGGGAGGLIYNSAFSVTPGTSYTVTVGNGGASVTVTRGNNGGNSVFGSLTAIGGGGGGNEQVGQAGLSGGSGGGGSYTGTGGAGTAGQGNAGGTAVSNAAQYAAAGGGGAGSVGGNPPNFNQGGAGGVGIPYSITGTLRFYAAGGGGSVYNASSVGTGGSGIGGNGGSLSGIAATNGSANTGSGGGGGERASGANNSGAGGSGIVVLRYKQVRTFTSAGSTTWTVPSGVTSVEVLVVAGGGGGGGNASGGQTPQGGGGAGGLVYNPFFTVTPGQTYTVTVGAGGAGGTSGSNVGANGGNSVFDTLTAVGGGGGGTSGGSGGGARNGSGGAGTTGQGFAGGNATGGANAAGGGGGAGSAGGTGGAGQTTGGTGGSGIVSSITGFAKFYGGGGGGGGYLSQGGSGGLGGGGAGGSGTSGNTPGTSATANTGGGGGGAGSASGGAGGGGGSGIVIVSYNSVNSDINQREGQIRYNSSTKSIETFKNTTHLSTQTIGWTNNSNVDGLVCLLDAGNSNSYPKLNIVGVKIWHVTTAPRSSNYTVQYSDNNSSWTTAFGGVMSSMDSTVGIKVGTVTSGGSGTTGNGSWGQRRFWRYVEGSPINGHHPRCSRITLVDINGIDHDLINYTNDNAADEGTYIVGTVATSTVSRMWYDLSGNNRHWRLNPAYLTFTEAGQQSYFDMNGSSSIAVFANGLQPFEGPRSDEMGFGQEHTIIAVTRVTASSINFFFHFVQTPVDVNNGSTRLSAHLYYGGGNMYYDFPGCCNGNNRVYKITQDASWVGNTKLATWRCRRDAFPNRQFWRDTTIEADSGTKNTGLANWNRSEVGTIGGGYNGRLYYLAFYNRALTDAELATEWATLTARFGIT